MGGIGPADLVVSKPSRSDEVIPPEEQVKTAREIRAYFDTLAPKRSLKPNRSEPDDSSPPLAQPLDDPPEFEKLQSLRSQSVSILADGRVYSVEEFVETDYYKRLNSIDKDHHTTGTGFIRVVGEGDGICWRLEEGGPVVASTDRVVVKTRTNPATNDWIPQEDQEMAFVSSKPNRSESEA